MTMKKMIDTVTSSVQQVYKMNTVAKDNSTLKNYVDRLIQLLEPYPAIAIYGEQFQKRLTQENIKDPMLLVMLGSIYTTISTRLQASDIYLDDVLEYHRETIRQFYDNLHENEIHLNLVNHYETAYLEKGHYPILDTCYLLNVYLDKNEIKRFLESHDKSPRKRKPRVQD